jgi:hypothetical protein
MTQSWLWARPPDRSSRRRASFMAITWTAARGRNPHDARTTKQEVLSPPFASGVEETHQLTAEGIRSPGTA